MIVYDRLSGILNSSLAEIAEYKDNDSLCP